MVTLEHVDLAQAAEELIAKHGSLRAAARALRIDHAYLRRLATGEKENPSAVTLKKLGLIKTTICIYYRRKP